MLTESVSLNLAIRCRNTKFSNITERNYQLSNNMICVYLNTITCHSRIDADYFAIITTIINNMLLPPFYLISPQKCSPNDYVARTTRTQVAPVIINTHTSSELNNLAANLLRCGKLHQCNIQLTYRDFTSLQLLTESVSRTCPSGAATRSRKTLPVGPQLSQHSTLYSSNNSSTEY